MKKKNGNFFRSVIAELRDVPSFLYWYIAWASSIVLILIITRHGDEYFFNHLPKSEVVITDRKYQFAYSGKIQGPAWVVEYGRSSDRFLIPDHIDFISDSELPTPYQTQISDFENTGFEISPLIIFHDNQQVPLSVCSPMLPKFQRIYWGKIENYAKSLVQKAGPDQVVMITGPLFLPQDEAEGKQFVKYQVIGEAKIAIPTHFFKAIFYRSCNPNSEQFYESEIFVIPHQDLKEDLPLDSFKRSIDDFRKISGIIPPDINDYFNRFIPQTPL